MINLIEQFGGYDETKKHLDSCWCDDDNRAYLLKKLLQYRREHNIFEVGDKVVFVSEKMDFLDDDKVHAISMITENNLLKVCGLYVGFDAVKHATPKEIQAGRRL